MFYSPLIGNVRIEIMPCW
ncbi:hypothetical protein YPPY54_3668, partial [Yersinia pestis PY-54]